MTGLMLSDLGLGGGPLRVPSRVDAALLEGFGLPAAPGSPADGDPAFHQRVYQLTACSIPLLVLRLPPVRRWIGRQQKAGRNWLVYLAVVPLGALFLLGFVFMANELIFKGVGAFTLHPAAD